MAVNRISPETLKPIHPAGGWTKKALERASRKIEFLQRWKIEKTGCYEINSSWQILEKKEFSRSEISQKARDIEVHTGAESFERFAKHETAEILETSKSWNELHEKLASKGFEFELKGNGAVLKYGDIAVELSNISRKSSFSKLKKKFGEYDVIIQTPLKNFSEKNNFKSKNFLWEKYQAEKIIIQK